MNEIEFIDANTVKGEKSDAVIKEEIEDWLNSHDTNKYGLWTNIEIAIFNLEHRGVPFLIKIISHGGRSGKQIIIKKGMNNLGKWAVVEYNSKKIGPIVDVIRDECRSEFLYYDSLHSGMEDWTLRRQVDEMIDLAHKDIDDLLDGKIEKELIEASGNIEKKLAKIRDFIASNNHVAVGGTK